MWRQNRQKSPKGYQSGKNDSLPYFQYDKENKSVSCFISVADEAHHCCAISRVELVGAVRSYVSSKNSSGAKCCCSVG